MKRIFRWSLMGMAVGLTLGALWFLWTWWTLARAPAVPPAPPSAEGRQVAAREPALAPAPAPAARHAGDGVPPAAAALAASSVRPARKPPRLLLIEAQASGSAEAAYLAAMGLSGCQAMEGAGQRAREALLRSGKALPGGQVDIFFNGIDLMERECQELDDAMKAQYEPLLRQAMAGGVPGAAAKWWVSSEGKAVVDASTQPLALELLRRDARACDKPTLMAYQALAIKYRSSFPSHEAHAVSAAAETLEKAGELQGNAGLRQVFSLLPPNLRLPEALAGEDFKATKAQILNACEANKAAGARRP